MRRDHRSVQLLLDKLIDVLKLASPKQSLSKQPQPEKRAHRHAASTRKKPYVRPEVHQITFNQGALILLGRAWDGDAGAKEFLTHLFPPRVEKVEISGRSNPSSEPNEPKDFVM
jgi:hypothetical protein